MLIHEIGVTEPVTTSLNDAREELASTADVREDHYLSIVDLYTIFKF